MKKKRKHARKHVQDYLFWVDGTTWHIAASDGKIDFIEYFVERIEYIGNVNKENLNGYTPIEEAAKNGHTEIVKMLMPLSRGPLTTEFDYPSDDEKSIARNDKLTEYVDRKIKKFLNLTAYDTNVMIGERGMLADAEEVARTHLSFCSWSINKALSIFRQYGTYRLPKYGEYFQSMKPKLSDEEHQHQKEKVQNFLEITYTFNEKVARTFLSKSLWNYEAAIETFFTDKHQQKSLLPPNEDEIQNDVIQKFMNITKIEDETVSRFYLSAHNWNFEAAVMAVNVESFKSDVKVTDDSETNEDFFNDDADAELSEEISNDSNDCYESSSDNEESSDSILKCSICEASFQDVLSLNEHVEKVHV